MNTKEKLGEHKIIEIIWKNLEKAPDMPIPFGDDVSAIEYRKGKLAILKTDMLVGKTDIPPQMSYEQAARKAVIMNVSDLAAKGVKPLGLIVALGLPRNVTKKHVELIAKGLNEATKEHNIYILGGDTNETEDLIISISLFGLANRENVILRSGAHPNDILATTGFFGLTSAGLKILKEKFNAPLKTRRKLVNSVLMPQARLKEGLVLAKTGAITASIDSSDGLAWSLHEISQASNIGFMIDHLPIAPEVFEFAKLHNFDPFQLALYGGEEYELVVTVEPKQWGKVEKTILPGDGKLIKIGRATKTKGIFLKQNGKMVKIKERGYEHFSDQERI